MFNLNSCSQKTTWLFRIGCLITSIFYFSLSPIVGQATLSSIQKKGDYYFDRADFRAAAQNYRQAGVDHSEDKDARLRMAITLYEVNDVDGALALLNTINNEGKTDPLVFFYIAKCYEAKNLFSEAITFHKYFLQRAKNDNDLRPYVKDQLIRCANGLRLKYGNENAYVENAGTVINTQYNDFGVRNSPTNLNKIYFSSDRINPEMAHTNQVDIYAVTVTNGKWAEPTLLPGHINASPYQEVSGFSSNGQILYYLIQQGNGFQIRTDTFSEIPSTPHKGFFSAPFDINRDGADLTFFNDSICLFSSNRPGGYGGYDLYISILNHGQWSPGTNLGPVINSFYDERYPFLTQNGLTLFYSSNNLASMGGFDIFSASFDPEKIKWSVPQNLGFPVNSSGNDTYMAIAADGTNGYLTSDRKEGAGQKDIYRVFFKQPLLAHQEISELPTFQQWILSRHFEPTSPTPQETPVDVKEYFVSHLFLEENAEILTPQNVKKLDLLSNLLLIYPKIVAEISCFEIPSELQTFSLYFSIKKAEEVRDYLVKKGINKDRLILKGYGPSFPLAKLPDGAANKAVYKKLNQRIEIGLHDYKTEPVIIHMENIPVPDNLFDPRGEKFESLRHGFYYSIQITSITQILQSANLESMQEVFIELDNNTDRYQYMTGMMTLYEDAAKLKEEMITMGFPDAKVIPYIDGVRIKAEDIPALVNVYPDLQFYLNGEK